jgi:predicted CXXCH cytochrome family protein
MTRKTLIGLGAAAFAAVTASSATAQISNSAHNFSGNAWSGGEICLPCHTPHNAMPDLPRLWNHELTVATYTMHEGTGTAADNFDTLSRLCLSCHDGTVALDSFGGQTGASTIAGRANLGTDLTNDHPVGSDALYPPDPPPSWWSGAFKDEADLPFAIGLEDYTDTAGATFRVVSCRSCHEPHNRGGYDHLLTMSNAASALCLGCHIK